MKATTILFVGALVMQSVPAHAAETPAEIVDAFAPLISRVRGAMRFQIEQGKGCFPWAILANNASDEKTFTQIGFNQETIDRLGGFDEKTVGKLIASAASIGTSTMSVVGTCETDSSISGAQSPNVIALVLERRDGAAVKLRFPYQQDRDGKVSYIESKFSGGPTQPLVFGSVKLIANQQAIAIAQQDQNFEITVPIARLAIRLPKAAFKQLPTVNVGGATASPRYFLLADEVRGIRLSGWFEPASAFVGVKDNQPSTLAGKTLFHKNVVFKKTGDWETVEFDTVEESLHVNMANVNAHLIRAESWVELHLSINSPQPLAEQHALLVSVLQSIQIVER